MSNLMQIVENEETSEFYPTPKALVQKMLAGVDWKYINAILEPSAGKGDILREIAIKENRYDTPYFDVDCIEIDPNLRQILKYNFSEERKNIIRRKDNELEPERHWNEETRRYETIELTITNGKITATACDGYRAAKTTVPILQNITNEFKCYIKPIKIKPCKKRHNKVVIIELENNIATVEIMTEYGKVKYHFEQFKLEGININKIFEDVQQNTDRKFGVNPAYIKQAVAALSQMLDLQKYVVFETQENNKAGFLIKAKEGKLISEQLILPMRITED